MKKPFVKLFKDQCLRFIPFKGPKTRAEYKTAENQQCLPLAATDTSLKALLAMQQRILDRLEDQNHDPM